MPLSLSNFDKKAKIAVQQFWGNRDAAMKKQVMSGVKDNGARGAVTAGKNMDGFAGLMEDVVRANGLKHAKIIKTGRLVTLPGYYRPTKMWDLLVIEGKELVAAVEFKSQVGSFGNNFNNRAEEAIGTAHDLSIAYREGAFGEQPLPFVGWFMLLEDAEGSRNPVSDNSPNYPIFNDFNNSSYAERYEILCKKMVQEQLYTSACLMLSPRSAVKTGNYTCLSELTNLKTFITNFAGHIASVVARKNS